MARMISFKKNDALIVQGEADTAAFLIHSGWLQVKRDMPGGAVKTHALGPGEIVGELGLAGLAPQRTANVVALTDGEVEVIDRGALIRLVNGPGNKLTPLLAALFSRLQTCLIDSEPDYSMDDTVVMLAKIEGISENAKRALCDKPRMINQLPWIMGAYSPPQSVTDLFRERILVQLKLADSSKLIREQHLKIDMDEKGVLYLHLLQHGDFCELDEQRLGYGNTPSSVPLSKGTHTLTFGYPTDPYQFRLEVLV